MLFFVFSVFFWFDWMLFSRVKSWKILKSIQFILHDCTWNANWRKSWRKQSIRCWCALLLCSLRFHEKSKNESVHSWRPFVKRHALALLLRFSLWFFFSLSFRLPLFFYIAFICCALSVLFHKAYQNGNGIFLESLFFSCWQATQQNPTHYTAQRVIKYMAQQ